VLLIIAGLAVMLLGAESLVHGAARLAAAAGVSSLVIGLTVVAFGTSSPELAVSLLAAARGEADIALGNVVGSNIFNILLILGVSALIRPLTVSSQLVRLDVPMMILASCAVPLAALNGRITVLEGATFLVMGAAYTLTLIRLGRHTGAVGEPAPRRRPRNAGNLPLQIVLVALGLVGLVVGSRWLVAGAVDLATAMGVSQLVIGLTIVAAGTSMPELATSLVATYRSEREIAVGNVVGSNIYNILFVLGVSAVAGSGGVAVAPDLLRFDIPVMMAAAIACLPIFFTGCRVSRWEGLLFVAYYAAFAVYLVLVATGHTALPAYRVAILGFVMPLTALGLGLSGWAARRR